MVGVHRSFFEAILAGEIMVSKTTNVGYPGVDGFVFQFPAAGRFLESRCSADSKRVPGLPPHPSSRIGQRRRADV
jgi:hypothetical protein